jgi:hypothetical protein
MSDPDQDPKVASIPEPSEQLDDVDMRALLKNAMRLEEAKSPAPDVLRGVQKKIRQRSRGKFYADGWSTTPSPKSTYFITALVMLALLVGLYFFLVPGGWGTP